MISVLWAFSCGMKGWKCTSSVSICSLKYSCATQGRTYLYTRSLEHLSSLSHSPKTFLSGEGIQTKICLCCSAGHLSLTLGTMLERRNPAGELGESSLSFFQRHPPGKAWAEAKCSLAWVQGRSQGGYCESHPNVSLWFQKNPYVNKPYSLPQ